MSELFERQRDHLFFTWSVQDDVVPIEIVDAAGARFCTRDQGWLWDLESQVYNVNAGHRHPHIQQRMIAQIEAMPAAAPNAVLPIRAELGELLRRHSGMHRAFLTTGGSEANENAVKMARLFTGRSKVITRRHSYHGATLAILGIAGDDRKAPFARDLQPAIHIDDPYPVPPHAAGEASAWVRSLAAVIEREGPATIAAILLEGLTGANGMQLPPDDFWPRARELCDAHGILLIADEIFSGFGRTGRWFACDRWGVRPDIMTIGKGLTSGYAPLAGVLVSPRIAAHFDDHKLWCGLTTYAHPVSCAAAVGAIEVYEREDLPGNADRVGAVLGERLDALQRAPKLGGLVRDHRGHGLMRVLELDRPVGPLATIALRHGLFLPTKGKLALICPPLCLEAGAVPEIGDRLEAALGELAGM
ncbi:MAG: aminotransferase class III-fold pyridoxal phosphate-dependent enzyme [Myxococcales bacterium]|nr:aminotransferase class III-fold pyridoxal phosphate-dependent enzyme [Myxococcales bacterium]